MISTAAKTQPIASTGEITRSGSSFFFGGQINGNPIRYRIDERVEGVVIPIAMAQQFKVVNGPMPEQIKKGTDWLVPVYNIFFGPYRIDGTMAHITQEGEEVIVGREALAGFAIRDVNGKHVLTPIVAAGPSSSVRND